MELHILEHRVRVLSIARPGLWLYTHPLVKLLFLRQRSRCKFFSLTETPEDYTLMLDEEGYKGMGFCYLLPYSPQSPSPPPGMPRQTPSSVCLTGGEGLGRVEKDGGSEMIPSCPAYSGNTLDRD
uniref:CASTOR1 N-terminal domain-containing protein n=1 Tax=Sarcophilus harrisii TaxID=9305 RepID=A0A7N4P7F0_SARHA